LRGSKGSRGVASWVATSKTVIRLICAPDVWLGSKGSNLFNNLRIVRFWVVGGVESGRSPIYTTIGLSCYPCYPFNQGLRVVNDAAPLFESCFIGLTVLGELSKKEIE
jgi:hypothetical protein